MSQAFAGSKPRLMVVGQADYQPVSDGSKTLQRILEEKGHYAKGTAADWSPILVPALSAIEDECGHDGWDGACSRAISRGTVTLAAAIAESLFALLPADTPAPDVIAEGDGEICLTWTNPDENIFALSISERGRINYAGQFGSEGARHGWQPIDASSRRTLEGSLGEVAGYISKLFPQKSPARRAA